MINSGSPFELESVLSAAQDEAGLYDFGDDGFKVPLAKLLETAAGELHFTSAGRMNFEFMVRRWLVNRLRHQRDVKAHPEILVEDVSDPIIILGMPRSGTTKAQRMLSADPTALCLTLWKTQNPAPFPGEKPGQPVERIAFARAIQEAQHQNNPDFVVSHERTAEDAEEDSDLLLFSLDYIMLYIINPAPSYLTWLRDRSRLPAYEYQKNLLQYLQWQEGGKQGRHWVLKNPGHTGNLDAINQVYPNATLVHLHRNLLEVMPSYCRLIESIYKELFEDVDPIRLGQEAVAYWAPEIRRDAEQRKALAGKLNIIDIPYLDLMRRPLETATTIYDQAGLTLTDEGRAAIAHWNEANAQHAFGKPDYSMERYGLTEAMIEDAFGTLMG